MQILKIKLSQDEENELFNELTKRFELTSEKQVIQGEIWYDYLIEFESTLELYTEMTEPDENNQNSIQ